MAVAVLVISILSGVFSIAHNGYLLAWDVQRPPDQPPAMTAPQPRQVIDMTPVETNLSLDGK